MIHLMRLLAIAALAVPFAGAEAGTPGPICRVPAVVERMAATLRLNPHYARLDPRLIEEAPTADPRVVRCAFCVPVLLYDTARFGDVPAMRCEAQAFHVRALRHGFVVQAPR